MFLCVIKMGLFTKMFMTKIDNSKREEPFTKSAEPKTFRWRFPIGPGKCLLTILAVSLLGFSLSYYSAWFFGPGATTYLLYAGTFFTTIMLLVDIHAVIRYLKERKNK